MTIIGRRTLLGWEERRSQRLAPLGRAKAHPYNDWRSMLRRYKRLDEGGDAGDALADY
jgi:hypothetical protein